MSGEKENKRRFNVTGLCVPEQDCMCDISDKVSQTTAMAERVEHKGKRIFDCMVGIL